MDWFNRVIRLLVLIALIPGCITYSLSGVSIPPGVKTIHFPFFPDQSSSGQPNLSDVLNESLLEQFVNQSPLRFSSDKNTADAVLEGRITTYTNRLTVVGGGNGQAQLNEISITVNATFRFSTDAKPVFSKAFTASAQYDPNTNAIDGERSAARQALSVIARNMFIDSLAKW
jgi:hypothetical protein